MKKPSRKLTELWEKKLAREGLADIEDSQGRLKRWHSLYFQNRFEHIGSFEAKREYFYKATHFLHEYPFEDAVEKKFWALHLEGKSNRQIERILKINRRRLGEIMNSLIQALLAWKQ